jgi:hypothetical protein
MSAIVAKQNSKKGEVQLPLFDVPYLELEAGAFGDLIDLLDELHEILRFDRHDVLMNILRQGEILQEIVAVPIQNASRESFVDDRAGRDRV